MAQPKTQQTRKRPGSSMAPGRRKSCLFCKDKIEEVDYKNLNQLRRYISEKGKIRNRRITGACRRHQRQVAVAVKRAREMALLPVRGGALAMEVILLKDVDKVGPPRRGRQRRPRLRPQLPAPAQARRAGHGRAGSPS